MVKGGDVYEFSLLFTQSILHCSAILARLLWHGMVHDIRSRECTKTKANGCVLSFMDK